MGQTVDEVEAVKKLGYRMVADLMKWNLPVSVWDHKREPYDDPDMFRMGALPQMEWMDKRLKRCIEAFNLAEDDVLIIRESFELALGPYISEVISTKDVCKFIDFPECQLTKWVFGAVNPKRKAELTFSEYVHVICYFSMFGRKELVRFLFGQMDEDGKYYLKKDEFEKLLGYLSEGTMRNPKVWMREWPKFMNPALKSIFLPEYEQFTNENTSTLWQIQKLKKKLMEKNLGVNYWDKKVEQYQEIRKEIGVVMV